MAGTSATTHLNDLPEPVLYQIFSLVSDVRYRNVMALACRRWRSIERATRSSIVLRGHVHSPFLLPTFFPAVSHLDLSLLSPWGHHPFLRSSSAVTNGGDQQQQLHHQLLIAHRLAQAFPCVTSLTIYARVPSVLAALAPRWPALRAVKLVRWHRRPPDLPLGADLSPLLAACLELASLDLSEFYCWTEDVPKALRDHPSAAASLRCLDLLCAASAEGFGSFELEAIAATCPNLTHLRAPCLFNPRRHKFVGDESLLALAAACPRLALLHLVDPAIFSPAQGDPDAAREDAGITSTGLEGLFMGLPHLEDIALDLCHNVRDSAPALEALSHRCPRIKSLKLGQFLGVCRGVWEHLHGVAVCGGLVSLSIKNSADLTDSGLATIARGCRRLSKLEIHGCGSVTETGIKKLVSMLRSTLVDVSISSCKLLDACRSLRAMDIIWDSIERLHIDFIWFSPDEGHQLPDNPEKADVESDGKESDDEVSEESSNKKCKYSDPAVDSNHLNDGISCSNNASTRTWKRLRYLSLWVPAGEVLKPLDEAGLKDCPNLEEVCIKVEGDCRTCPKPSNRVFGLSFFGDYPKLAKMKLDCGEAIGYALTAPTGHMDLSSWERFYLTGIGLLNLYELDYWPPQDKEVNQRSLSLPAAGLIQGCFTLRKLFIHGTTHEHFMRFFLEMPCLRDVQLREDYYPAPENDMSTEMRVDSWSRFEEALNDRRNRVVPD